MFVASREILSLLLSRSEKMDEIQLAISSYKLIQKDLGISDPISLINEKQPFDELHKFLSVRVQYLLDRDFGQLLNSLYRIDIPEQQVKRIINEAEPEKIASLLAEAIINREILKVKTRLKYSS